MIHIKGLGYCARHACFWIRYETHPCTMRLFILTLSFFSRYGLYSVNHLCNLSNKEQSLSIAYLGISIIFL